MPRISKRREREVCPSGLGDHRLPGLEPEAFGHVAQEAWRLVPRSLLCGSLEIFGSGKSALSLAEFSPPWDPGTRALQEAAKVLDDSPGLVSGLSLRLRCWEKHSPRRHREAQNEPFQKATLHFCALCLGNELPDVLVELLRESEGRPRGGGAPCTRTEAAVLKGESPSALSRTDARLTQFPGAEGMALLWVFVSCLLRFCKPRTC